MAPAGTTGLSASADVLVGSAERTTAKELASRFLGTSGHCLKSEGTIFPATEVYMKVAEFIMFGGLKIDQKCPLKA